jgi:hypothetical protein
MAKVAGLFGLAATGSVVANAKTPAKSQDGLNPGDVRMTYYWQESETEPGKFYWCQRVQCHGQMYGRCYQRVGRSVYMNDGGGMIFTPSGLIKLKGIGVQRIPVNFERTMALINSAQPDVKN